MLRVEIGNRERVTERCPERKSVMERRAAIAEFTTNACFEPTNSRNSSSNWVHREAVVSQLLLTTSITSRISSQVSGLSKGMCKFFSLIESRCFYLCKSAPVEAKRKCRNAVPRPSKRRVDLSASGRSRYRGPRSIRILFNWDSSPWKYRDMAGRFIRR